MPTYSFNGSASNTRPPSSTKILGGATLGLAGLDMTTPVDLLKAGKSPFAKNFRLYAQQADSRKVAVSSRKGAGYFHEPVGQVTEYQQIATTGASTANTGVILGQQATRFQATTSNHLTRIDVKVADLAATSGSLLVEVWSDNSGLPGKRLAASSIDSGSIGGTAAYLPARFMNNVKLTTSTYYWIIVRMQDDGVGQYALSTTTAYAGYKTDSTLNGLAIQTYGMNIKIYSTPEATFKGTHRFLRDNGTNTTMVAYGTAMYYIDGSNLLQPILTGLNSNATEYRYANADNKVFWVNGYDILTAWDGTFEATNSTIVTNGTFEVNANGWTTDASINGTVARSTAEHNTGVGSLSITNSAGSRAANQSMTIAKNQQYHIKLAVKVATAGTVNLYGITTASSAFVNGATIKIGADIAATTSWQLIDFYYTATDAFIGLQIRGASGIGTIFIDDVSIVPTGVSFITDPDLRIASDIMYNKDRLWTKAANDPNFLQWCEAPGNPSAKTSLVDSTQIVTQASEQWYNSWRSVDYRYVPRPHNGSPVVRFIGFQNAITVFTQDKKYIVDGYDTGSYTMRESTGSKGAVGSKSVAVDENFVWFVGSDGFYKYNGSSDEKISVPIAAIFDACPRKADIRPVVWQNQVRFYMASSGSPYNDICMIYDKDLDEWMMDTEVYVRGALWLNDLNDSQDLLESSSTVPQLYYADKQYSNLGAPIDFEYRFTYDSMKTPGQKKRIKRFVPILQGVDSTFPITLGMDKDFQDSPKIKTLVLTTNGAVLNTFTLGDGTILGGNKSFKSQRQSYSGYANYWQFRLSRYAANNRIAFVGAQYTYKTKRL